MDYWAGTRARLMKTCQLDPTIEFGPPIKFGPSPLRLADVFYARKFIDIYHDNGDRERHAPLVYANTNRANGEDNTSVDNTKIHNENLETHEVNGQDYNIIITNIGDNRDILPSPPPIPLTEAAAPGQTILRPSSIACWKILKSRRLRIN
ncbi:unnamed protein product [Arabis nemorensis]|uniref:Uncharacterized protein n=1 Tax=Arabis nemorensis TaxID=586526 RepID=A0A565CCS1_9BRAS|nr:unnamed protein product [Arabis nemorensis]